MQAELSACANNTLVGHREWGDNRIGGTQWSWDLGKSTDEERKRTQVTKNPNQNPYTSKAYPMKMTAQVS